jgi:predicted heme/steroid binding protein
LETASIIPEKQTPGEAAKNVSGEEPKRFTLEELKNYDGLDSRQAYILFEGKVYDVTDSGFWQAGDHLGAHRAGRDLSQDILSAPHGPEVLSKMKQIGVVA